MILFKLKDWKLTTYSANVQQYDNLSSPIVISGEFPPEYSEWKVYIAYKENLDIVPLAENEDGTMTADLTDEQLSFSGLYAMQVFARSGDKVRHSSLALVDVPCSLSGDAHWPELPKVFSDALERAEEAADSSEESYEKAADAITKYPKIGENGNWFVWDVENQTWVDTGYHSGAGQLPAHNALQGRDASDAHPMSSITGLENSIGNLSDRVDAIESRPYTSLERLRSYLYRVTFEKLPDENGTYSPVVGGCTSFVSGGKLYRNLDWYYSETPTFIVNCNGFCGIAFLDSMTEGNLNDDLIGQLPYHMADGRNDSGIMVSTHVLYNDWQWRGTGDTPIYKIPYLILSRIKTLQDFSSQMAGILADITSVPALDDSEYLLQFLVTDGTTTYAILPPMSSSGAYQVVDITSNPKLTNFRWVNSATVVRGELQTRPTGVERWNAVPSSLESLRFTVAYEEPTRLSEFIGINETTKDSTDEELLAIYELAHDRYEQRTRDGGTWQTMHSVVYSSVGMEALYVQEDFSRNYSTYIPEATLDHRDLTNRDAEDQHPISSITGLTTQLETLTDDIIEFDERLDDVEDLIPDQASASNQLADKNFVNSSVATNTAYFRGTYDVVADLGLTYDATEEEIANALATVVTEKTNNDYVFVFFIDPTTSVTTKYERFKYSSEDGWAYEFTLNNSSFTANQWSAINSGITDGKVALIDTALQPADIADRLKEPSTGLAVGKYFRIASIDESGHAVLEAVDAPSSAMKIKFAGTAQTPDVDGYVNVPLAASENEQNHIGLVKSRYPYTWGDENRRYIGIKWNVNNQLGNIGLYPATGSDFNSGYRSRSDIVAPIVISNLDHAVKCAMTDGIGAVWTDAEKTGAWKRLNSIKTTMDAVAVAGAQYYLGEQSAVSVTMPTDAEVGQEITVVFSSGATACTLTCDLAGFDFAPKANKTNKIIFTYNGTDWLVEVEEG